MNGIAGTIGIDVGAPVASVVVIKIGGIPVHVSAMIDNRVIKGNDAPKNGGLIGWICYDDRYCEVGCIARGAVRAVA